MNPSKMSFKTLVAVFGTLGVLFLIYTQINKPVAPLPSGRMPANVVSSHSSLKNNQEAKKPIKAEQMALFEELAELNKKIATNSGALAKYESENEAYVHVIEINGYTITDWESVQIKDKNKMHSASTKTEPSFQ